MQQLHSALGLILIVANLVVAIWAALLSRDDERAAQPPRAFIHLAAAAWTLVAAVGLAGLALILGGDGAPSDRLHSRVYGPFMVVALLSAYGFREDGRPGFNIRVTAIASLIVVLLGLRAAFTG